MQYRIFMIKKKDLDGKKLQIMQNLMTLMEEKVEKDQVFQGIKVVMQQDQLIVNNYF